jgi:hypothetical protein
MSIVSSPPSSLRIFYLKTNQLPLSKTTFSPTQFQFGNAKPIDTIFFKPSQLEDSEFSAKN